MEEESKLKMFKVVYSCSGDIVCIDEFNLIEDSTIFNRLVNKPFEPCYINVLAFTEEHARYKANQLVVGGFR